MDRPDARLDQVGRQGLFDAQDARGILRDLLQARDGRRDEAESRRLRFLQVALLLPREGQIPLAFPGRSRSEGRRAARDLPRHQDPRRGDGEPGRPPSRGSPGRMLQGSPHEQGRDTVARAHRDVAGFQRRPGVEIRGHRQRQAHRPDRLFDQGPTQAPGPGRALRARTSPLGLSASGNGLPSRNFSVIGYIIPGGNL